MLNVYFIHANWLKNRERNIIEFKKMCDKYTWTSVKGINVKVVNDFDPNTITAELISKTVSYTPIVENTTNNIHFYNNFLKNMHTFNLSCTLKHCKAMELIMNESTDDDINIVLEDDILFDERICFLLETFIDKYKSDDVKKDIVFLGLPINKESTNDPSFIKCNSIFRVLPYCDSYLISKETAQKMYTNFLPIRFISNVQLSYVMELLAIEPFILTPNIFVDGSKYGTSLSTQVPNNSLIFNKEYMQLKALVIKEHNTPEELKIIDEILEKSPLIKHPDFLHIKAIQLSKQRDFEESKKTYEEALDMYQTNNSILNHESEFLGNYLRLHKQWCRDI